MKHLFSLLLLACLPATASVIVNLDQSALIGTPGQTVTFFGTLENTSGDLQYITTLALNTAPELNGDATPFFLNGLLFLSFSYSVFPGATTMPFALFDVEIPLGTAPGTYSLNNDFALFGGLSDTSADTLGNAGFTVIVENPVPEPATFGLMALAVAGTAALRAARNSSTAP